MIDPSTIADQSIGLAEEYSRLSDELSEILKVKPAEWIKLRGENKSDTSTDRAWEFTEQGNRETIIKIKLKALEKMLNANTSKVYTENNKARNNY